MGASNPRRFAASPTETHPTGAGPEPGAGPASYGEIISRKPHLVTLGFLTSNFGKKRRVSYFTVSKSHFY